jgi:hypothetical protein
MTLFYPGPEGVAGAHDMLYAFRLLFGSGMVLSVVLGFIAIRRGDMIRHRAWMTRAYAIGLGAATQMLPAAEDGGLSRHTLLIQKGF